MFCRNKVQQFELKHQLQHISGCTPTTIKTCRIKQESANLTSSPSELLGEPFLVKDGLLRGEPCCTGKMSVHQHTVLVSMPTSPTFYSIEGHDPSMTLYQIAHHIFDRKLGGDEEVPMCVYPRGQ